MFLLFPSAQTEVRKSAEIYLTLSQTNGTELWKETFHPNNKEITAGEETLDRELSLITLEGLVKVLNNKLLTVIVQMALQLHGVGHRSLPKTEM